MAAFYSGFQLPEAPNPDVPMMQARATEDTSSRSIKVPSTGDMVPAKFLAGRSPHGPTPIDHAKFWRTGSQPKTIRGLQRWRPIDCGAAFMGQGIVQPVDDFSDNNPPSHPEVLNLLAEQFSGAWIMI